MTTTTDYYAAKGGQGCTTVAALHAAGLAANGARVLLVDRTANRDAARVFGAPVPDAGGIAHTLTPNLALLVEPGPDYDAAGYDHVVTDWGTTTPTTTRPLTLVTRACYLAAVAAVTHPNNPDAIVLVAEPNRALGARYVAAAIGAPVTLTIAVDPAIARVIDAGLLAARLPAIASVFARGTAIGTVTGDAVRLDTDALDSLAADAWAAHPRNPANV